MNMTPKQLEALLRQVVRDETVNLATKGQVDDLTTTVDGLAKKIETYLDEEWHVHIHAAHPRLEKRLNRIEKKLG